MTGNAILQLVVFLTALIAVALPLGRYMAWVFGEAACKPQRPIGFVEGSFYRMARIDASDDMTWLRYVQAVLSLNLMGVLLVYLVLRLQGHLPMNPTHAGAVPWAIAFNTAVSFATNTNWQAYGGEATLSHLSQMVALTSQNFISAATGMAVLLAVVRGFARNANTGVGNFWVDLTRTVVYVLLPISLVIAVALVSEGVVQTLVGTVEVQLIQPYLSSTQVVNHQTLAIGPVASQEAIKQLGTNGGGFFNANSAHPFENPTPVSNFIEMLAILAIPSAQCFTFGALVREPRQGRSIAVAMFAILIPLMVLTIVLEQSGNPGLHGLALDQVPSHWNLGGNMEGKEARFGITDSAMFAVATTAASNGSVNAMLDSFTPLGGLIVMWQILLGEVVFGGVGSGLYGMLVFAMIAVFIAGLMVGRTPEYLGKKIEAFEMKMASLVVLIPAALTLIGAAIACVSVAGSSAVGNPGPHGFSEILYAFASAANNNGSAMGGLRAASDFYAIALGVVMCVGRFGVIVPVLAIAGALAKKRKTPPSLGTLRTDTPLFTGLLVGTVVLVGALTYVPALALGSVVEHLQLLAR